MRHSLVDFGWREEHTRYTIIDPILRALGWKTEDPKDLHPEYPRADNGARVDYALFGSMDLQVVEKKGMPIPNVLIEAKALETSLTDVHLRQLQRYVNHPTRMTEGLAVLTNGINWWIYELEGRKTLRGMSRVEVKIGKGNQRRSAEKLHEHLHRQRWTGKTQS